MGLHSKDNPLDNLLHVLLTSVMIGCVVVCTLEIWVRDSFLLAIARPLMVMFQGTWFIQVGHILFQGASSIAAASARFALGRGHCMAALSRRPVHDALCRMARAPDPAPTAWLRPVVLCRAGVWAWDMEDMVCARPWGGVWLVLGGGRLISCTAFA